MEANILEVKPKHWGSPASRLAEIVRSESAEADDAALELIARRAAGSMRDSQSLLEQVLSFSNGKLTADQVHTMLGTADDERLHALATALAERDAASAIRQMDAAIDAGVDAGRLAEQLLGYFRDLMAVVLDVRTFPIGAWLDWADPTPADLERGRCTHLPPVKKHLRAQEVVLESAPPAGPRLLLDRMPAARYCNSMTRIFLIVPRSTPSAAVSGTEKGGTGAGEGEGYVQRGTQERATEEDEMRRPAFRAVS